MGVGGNEVIAKFNNKTAPLPTKTLDNHIKRGQYNVPEFGREQIRQIELVE